jgi:ATP diphosphatase
MMDLLEKIVRLEKEAENFGFKWENTTQIMRQIRSECDEISVHLKNPKHDVDKIKLQEEIGDLLHAVFSLCVFSKLSPQATLEKSLTKFEQRLNAVKQIAAAEGLSTLANHSFDELMNYWEQAKKQVEKTQL